MKPPGSYKLLGRTRSCNPLLDPMRCAGRGQRIIDSLRAQIAGEGVAPLLRIRRVFDNPRAIYRIELELPEMNYQRVTLLDGDALEELLEVDEVRTLIDGAIAG